MRKILGENLLRALEGAERVARASQGQVSREGNVRRLEAEKKQ